MVYDCFTFFNELDLLEIRFNTLNGVVDKFVLCEAKFTHQGNSKPLYYEQNKQRYAPFSHKIIHVKVDIPPPNPSGSAWILENYQRQMLVKGLKQCKPDDVIMISDLDEIPNPDKINAYKFKKGIKIFRQKMYYYFLNCLNASNAGKFRWVGTIMVNYKDMKSPQALRNIITDYINITTQIKPLLKAYCRIRLFVKMMLKGKLGKVFIIDNGGWHFSYLGGIDMIVQKIEAFAHAELNRVELKSEEKLENAINKGEDIFGRPYKYTFVEIDETFPQYIVEHKLAYKNLIRETRNV